MKRTPIEAYGFGFISGDQIPPQKNEYYLRDQQIQHWNVKWRALTQSERVQLKAQGNYSPNWDHVLVEDPIDISLIRRNAFYGLVRIASLEPYVVSYHDFALPEGIRDSHIISSDIGRHCVIHRCAYISHYIIGHQCMLNEIDEMDATNHAKFGNGIVKEGEPEDVRIWLSVMNEAETRRILPFESLICADAWLWGTYRERTRLIDRLATMTQKSFSSKRGWYAEVGDRTVIKSCRVIKDVKIGSHAYVKGANKLKNLTIRSQETSATQIGEGVELVNGIIGFGCRVFYGVKAVRFIMGNNSNLKYGARLLNSVLGDNSTISCCEVLNTLVFPFHEQHHNNSFLIASLVMGQSNMAAGANIGSNHNTRGNDGEMQANRGFWPALSSSLKFNSSFAAFTLITKGDYPNELSIPIPFSMVGYRELTGQVTIMPAYWWMYNRYALERNAWKFRKRDTRTIKKQHIETDYLAPDTIEEIERGMQLLSLWVGQAALAAGLIAPGVGSSESALVEQGRMLLETHPEQVGTLEVLAHGIERSATPALIFKVAEGYRAYKEMLVFGCMRILCTYCNEQGNTIFEFQKRVTDKLVADRDFFEAVSGPFRNMGGQLVSEGQIRSLIQKIEEERIDTWDAIHTQYDQWWELYPLVKATVALQALQRISQTIELDKSHWESLVSRFTVLCDQNAFEVYRSRKKDFEDPFRKIVYRNDEEMIAVLGKTDENPFVQESRRAMESLKELVRRFPPQQ
jgi:NDP-sugar pyrophosphorylase family protein